MVSKWERLKVSDRDWKMAKIKNRIKSKSELGITRVKDSFRADFQWQGRQTRLGQRGENFKERSTSFQVQRESE